MTRNPAYEVVVVGGGPAGLTTSLYTTRLGHRTAVVNREGGRYASVTSVHNFLGVSEDASGREVSELAVDQLEEYGADFYRDGVREIERVGEAAGTGDAEAGSDGSDDSRSDEARDFENEADADTQFRVTADNVDLLTDRIVLATGFEDVPPRVRGLRQFVGGGLHYCLHCDAYTLGDEPVFVLGNDDHAAEMAMLMLNFTDDVDLLLDDEEPEWSDETAEQVAAHPVEVVADRVDHAFAAGDEADSIHDQKSEAETAEGPAGDPWLGGLAFA
ncbi:NAD(P)/FAD-dependent oxidoreductase, partial [Halobacteriales archaeon QS_1_67_19]